MVSPGDLDQLLHLYKAWFVCVGLDSMTSEVSSRQAFQALGSGGLVASGRGDQRMAPTRGGSACGQLRGLPALQGACSVWELRRPAPTSVLPSPPQS